MTHTTAFVTPVVDHWLKREIAQWDHPMKDQSDDPLHNERTLLPRSYISLPWRWSHAIVDFHFCHIDQSPDSVAACLDAETEKGSLESQSQPEEVRVAREEIKVLHDEKRKTEKLRMTVKKELEAARQKTTKLEEVKQTSRYQSRLCGGLKTGCFLELVGAGGFTATLKNILFIFVVLYSKYCCKLTL